jgi:hypothetical protein
MIFLSLVSAFFFSVLVLHESRVTHGERNTKFADFDGTYRIQRPSRIRTLQSGVKRDTLIPSRIDRLVDLVVDSIVRFAPFFGRWWFGRLDV